MPSTLINFMILGMIIFITVLAAELLFYAIYHEFKDCDEWFGQGRKLYEFQHNISQGGEYVSSLGCLYSAVFRQKGNYAQKVFQGEKERFWWDK